MNYRSGKYGGGKKGGREVNGMECVEGERDEGD